MSRCIHLNISGGISVDLPIILKIHKQYTGKAYVANYPPPSTKTALVIQDKHTKHNPPTLNHEALAVKVVNHLYIHPQSSLKEIWIHPSLLCEALWLNLIRCLNENAFP